MSELDSMEEFESEIEARLWSIFENHKTLQDNLHNIDPEQQGSEFGPCGTFAFHLIGLHDSRYCFEQEESTFSVGWEAQDECIDPSSSSSDESPNPKKKIVCSPFRIGKACELTCEAMYPQFPRQSYMNVTEEGLPRDDPRSFQVVWRGKLMFRGTFCSIQGLHLEGSRLEDRLPPLLKLCGRTSFDNLDKCLQRIARGKSPRKYQILHIVSPFESNYALETQFVKGQSVEDCKSEHESHLHSFCRTCMESEKKIGVVECETVTVYFVPPFFVGAPSRVWGKGFRLIPSWSRSEIRVHAIVIAKE